jgi:hypothetical protein
MLVAPQSITKLLALTAIAPLSPVDSELARVRTVSQRHRHSTPAYPNFRRRCLLPTAAVLLLAESVPSVTELKMTAAPLPFA